MSDCRRDVNSAWRASHNFKWTSRCAMAFLIASLAGAAGAVPGDNAGIVRELASRVGPIVGSALACHNIAQPASR